MQDVLTVCSKISPRYHLAECRHAPLAQVPFRKIEIWHTLLNLTLVWVPDSHLLRCRHPSSLNPKYWLSTISSLALNMGVSVSINEYTKLQPLIQNTSSSVSVDTKWCFFECITDNLKRIDSGSLAIFCFLWTHMASGHSAPHSVFPSIIICQM